MPPPPRTTISALRARALPRSLLLLPPCAFVEVHESPGGVPCATTPTHARSTDPSWPRFAHTLAPAAAAAPPPPPCAALTLALVLRDAAAPAAAAPLVARVHVPVGAALVEGWLPLARQSPTAAGAAAASAPVAELYVRVERPACCAELPAPCPFARANIPPVPVAPPLHEPRPHHQNHSPLRAAPPLPGFLFRAGHLDVRLRAQGVPANIHHLVVALRTEQQALRAGETAASRAAADAAAAAKDKKNGGDDEEDEDDEEEQREAHGPDRPDRPDRPHGLGGHARHSSVRSVEKAAGRVRMAYGGRLKPRKEIQRLARAAGAYVGALGGVEAASSPTGTHHASSKELGRVHATSLGEKVQTALSGEALHHAVGSMFDGGGIDSTGSSARVGRRVPVDGVGGDRALHGNAGAGGAGKEVRGEPVLEEEVKSAAGGFGEDQGFVADTKDGKSPILYGGDDDDDDDDDSDSNEEFDLSEAADAVNVEGGDAAENSVSSSAKDTSRREADFGSFRLSLFQGSFPRMLHLQVQESAPLLPSPLALLREHTIRIPKLSRFSCNCAAKCNRHQFKFRLCGPGPADAKIVIHLDITCTRWEPLAQCNVVTPRFRRLFADTDRMVRQLRDAFPDAAEQTYLFVGGLFTQHYPTYFNNNIDFLRNRLRYPKVETVAIHTEGSVARNARIIKDAVLKAAEGEKSVVLIGHSKGGVDAVSVLDQFPEAVPFITGIVSFQAPFGGTYLIDFVTRRKLAAKAITQFIESVWKGDQDAIHDMSYQARLRAIGLPEHLTSEPDESDSLVEAGQEAHQVVNDVTVQLSLQDRKHLDTLRSVPIVSFASCASFDVLRIRNAADAAGVASMAPAAQIITQKTSLFCDGLVTPADARIPFADVVLLDDMMHTEPALYVKGTKYPPGPLTAAALLLLFEKARKGTN